MNYPIEQIQIVKPLKKTEHADAIFDYVKAVKAESGNSDMATATKKRSSKPSKTDDNDLETIFHAAINGYGLATLPVDDNYRSLQRLTRHRGIHVKQRAKLQVQMRNLMHQSMPDRHVRTDLDRTIADMN